MQQPSRIETIRSLRSSSAGAWPALDEVLHTAEQEDVLEQAMDETRFARQDRSLHREELN